MNEDDLSVFENWMIEQLLAAPWMAPPMTKALAALEESVSQAWANTGMTTDITVNIAEGGPGIEVMLRPPGRSSARLAPRWLALLVLIWLVLLSEPALQLRLSPALQEVLNSETGTAGLALALTAIVTARKAKGGKGED